MKCWEQVESVPVWMNCNNSERQWELAVVFLRLVLASVPLLRLKPALMIDWLEDRKVNRLTPMIALSSAMLTCLDLSTAWATWCWCCKNTQTHTWSMNNTKQLIEKIFKDREQTYKTTTRGETCYTTAPFIVKTTNKAEAHVPHTAGPLKRVVVVLCGRPDVPRGPYDYK